MMATRPFGFGSLLLAVASLTGCVSKIHVPLDEISPESRLAAVPVLERSRPIPALEPPGEPLDVHNQTIERSRRGGHEIRLLTFAASGPNGQPGDTVEGIWYRTPPTEPRPVVVVLPIWGASTYPPNTISRGLLRRHGDALHLVRVQGESRIFDWDRLMEAADPDSFAELVEEMAERLRTHVVDLRRLIRWLAARPEIDQDRIALVGFSIGATVGAMVKMSEESVERAVLAMGGARIADIAAHCRGLRRELRETIENRFGWNRERYRDLFVAVFAELDPANHPGRVDPSRVLLIDARHDDCMPEVSREALWEAMGRPERITYRYKHRTAFYAMTPLGLNTMRREIYRFLDELLD